MKKHTKIYLDHFDVSYSPETGECEPLKCENCGCKRVVDIHHIDNKGMGGAKGKDFIENLIGLCRECHDAAHRERITKSELIEKHKLRMKSGNIHELIWS